MNVSKHTFFTLLLWGCTEEKPQQEDDTTITQRDPNNNGDESLNILILGSEQSITDGVAFSASQIATELESILTSDTSLTYDIQVRAEDIHLSTDVTIGLGGNGAEYTYTHHSHSLLQYYYWPDGMADRHANLKGEGGMVWDHVIIAADPYIVATTPGYYALGVNKISSKVSSGIAEPHLLMIWPQVEYASVSQYKEFIYRTAENAKEPLRVIPAALAWSNLEESQQDSSATHPSPHGAYLTASSIYSHLTGKNAVETGYSYQDDLAEVAFEMMNEAEEQGYDSQSLLLILLSPLVMSWMKLSRIIIQALVRQMVFWVVLIGFLSVRLNHWKMVMQVEAPLILAEPIQILKRTSDTKSIQTSFLTPLVFQCKIMAIMGTHLCFMD